MIYVGHFWPPNFCPIYVQPLIHNPKSLIFTHISIFLSSVVPVTYVDGSLQVVSGPQPMAVRVQCLYKGGRRGHVGGGKKCASVRVKLFWHAIYCAKPRPNIKSQSGSQSRRGMWGRAPQIMREYNLVTAILIRPLTQPHTCEMGSSIFSAMS